MERIIIYDLSQASNEQLITHLDRQPTEEYLIPSHATLYIQDQNELRMHFTKLNQLKDNSEIDNYLRIITKNEYQKSYHNVESISDDEKDKQVKRVSSIQALFIIVLDAKVVDEYFNDEKKNEERKIEVHRFENYKLITVEVFIEDEMEDLLDSLSEHVGILYDNELPEGEDLIGKTINELLRYYQNRRLRNFGKHEFFVLDYKKLTRNKNIFPEDKLENFLLGHDERVNEFGAVEYNSYFKHYDKELSERSLMYQKQLAEVGQLKIKHTKEREQLQLKQPMDYRPFLKLSNTKDGTNKNIDLDIKQSR